MSGSQGEFQGTVYPRKILPGSPKVLKVLSVELTWAWSGQKPQTVGRRFSGVGCMGCKFKCLQVTKMITWWCWTIGSGGDSGKQESAYPVYRY